MPSNSTIVQPSENDNQNAMDLLFEAREGNEIILYDAFYRESIFSLPLSMLEEDSFGCKVIKQEYSNNTSLLIALAQLISNNSVTINGTEYQFDVIGDVLFEYVIEA